MDSSVSVTKGPAGNPSSATKNRSSQNVDSRSGRDPLMPYVPWMLAQKARQVREPRECKTEGNRGGYNSGKLLRRGSRFAVLGEHNDKSEKAVINYNQS